MPDVENFDVEYRILNLGVESFNGLTTVYTDSSNCYRSTAKMAFSDSIAALLETYSNCATLLKAYKHDANGEDGNVKVDAQNKHLRKSLKADRAMVERAYSIRSAELGSHLKTGDGMIKHSHIHGGSIVR